MDAASASLPTRTQIWMRHLLHSPLEPKYGCGTCFAPHPNPNMDAASASLPTRTQIWMRHLLHSPPEPKYGCGICFAPHPNPNMDAASAALPTRTQIWKRRLHHCPTSVRKFNAQGPNPRTRNRAHAPHSARSLLSVSSYLGCEAERSVRQSAGHRARYLTLAPIPTAAVAMFGGGLIMTISTMPPWWSWFHWTSFIRYAWAAQMNNQFRDTPTVRVAGSEPVPRHTHREGGGIRTGI